MPQRSRTGSDTTAARHLPVRSTVRVLEALPRSRPPAGSLTAAVTEQIRAAIVDGRFALGEALSELKLAAALKVSRTPIREALTALQLQGLIDVRPQAGSFVFLPSDEDVAELAEFRRLLESAALRLCHARRRDQALRQMREAVDAMERARDADDRLGVARADTAFHQAIVENSANEYLIAAYRLVSGRVAALRTHNLMAAITIRNRSLAEHRALIAALTRGDVDRAQAILDEHIRRMRLRFDLARTSHRARGSP
jgi:DNA-binding GntR family transcriptional regulator